MNLNIGYTPEWGLVWHVGVGWEFNAALHLNVNQIEPYFYYGGIDSITKAIYNSTEEMTMLHFLIGTVVVCAAGFFAFGIFWVNNEINKNGE